MIGQYITTSDTSILEGMMQIDTNAVGLLYVVDSEGRLVGTLSDGDIRRWFLRGGQPQAQVREAMNPAPKYVAVSQKRTARQYMRAQGIHSVVIVDDDHHPVDIIFSEYYLEMKKLGRIDFLKDTPIVIMAGGIGSRLRPYTKVLPKPLIPIGDIPIVERIMNRFHEYGADGFYLTVNYKKEMIRSYFSDVSSPYQIRYVEEDRPLGTAGGIRLIKEEFVSPVIVTNCDILIETDYQSLMEHHKESGNDMTIVSSLKNIVIPYGVIHIGRDGTIESMEEKPKISNFINTGMYVVAPECLQYIPVGECYHMTQLADRLMREGKRVGMYPISEDSFLDMGQIEEMNRMEERIKAHE